jgi:hypothetical protein
MKKITLIITSAILLGFVACNSSKNKEAETSRKELNDYIDSVRNVTPEYTTTYWSAIDDGYKTRVTKAEAYATEESQKKELEKSKNDYQELKSKYDAEVQKNNDMQVANKKQQFRDALFGEGKIGTDMSFDWVTAANIRSVYENFVNAVDANKKNYSREDWDEIKVLYEALDTRKNEVEKDLASKDNMKIAKEKIRFSTIETTHRPLAKVSENSDAKQ